MTHELAKRIVESWGDDHDAEHMMRVETAHVGVGIHGRVSLARNPVSGVLCRDWPDFVAAVAMMFAENYMNGDDHRLAKELRNLRADGMGTQVIIY